jgi:hypothetical protein
MSNVHNHPPNKSAKPARVKTKAPRPTPAKARKITLPRRDPRSKRRG